jgi:hypothetical protein
MNDNIKSSTSSLFGHVRCSLDREDQATTESRSAPPGAEHFSNVPTSLPLLHGKMTLADALDEEDNVLFPLAYSSQREDFLFWIYEHREDFKALLSLHLGLASSETCRFGHRSNIFVDSNWHIKYIIDLEWACSLPIEIMRC